MKVRVCAKCSKVIGTDSYTSVTPAVRGAETLYYHHDDTDCFTYTQPAISAVEAQGDSLPPHHQGSWCESCYSEGHQ